jgi:hypothetical protein
MKLPSLIKNSIYRKMFTGGRGPSDEETQLVNSKSSNKFGSNSFTPINSFKGAFDQQSAPMAAPSFQPYANPEKMGMYRTPEENRPQVDKIELADEQPKTKTDWDGLRSAMYTGNALLRGFSEKNARDQQNQYLQNNLANPLANMAYNDGRSKQNQFGYEQFPDGGSVKPYGKKYAAVETGDNNAMQHKYMVDLQSRNSIMGVDGKPVWMYNATDTDSRQSTIPETDIASQLGHDNNSAITNYGRDGKIRGIDSFYSRTGDMPWGLHIPKKPDGGFPFKNPADSTRVVVNPPLMNLKNSPVTNSAPVPHYTYMAGNTANDSATYRNDFNQAILDSKNTTSPLINGNEGNLLNANVNRNDKYLMEAMSTSGAMGYMGAKQTLNAHKDAFNQLNFKGFRRGGKKLK